VELHLILSLIYALTAFPVCAGSRPTVTTPNEANYFMIDLFFSWCRRQWKILKILQNTMI